MRRLVGMALFAGAVAWGEPPPSLTDPAWFRPLVKRKVDAKRKRVVENKEAEPPDRAALAAVEKRFGALPPDYRAIVAAYRGGDLCPTKRSCLFLHPLATALELADDGLVDLGGALPIGSDNGEIVLFYDAGNRLGRGAFAVFSYDRGAGPAAKYACFEGATLAAAVDALARGHALASCPSR